MEIEVIGVPFDGYGRNGHHARAATVLREAGLVDALAPHTVHDDGDLPLPAFEKARGPQTGLRNEPALLAATDQLHARVAAAIGSGRFPILIGGDCSLLLGAITGLREATDRPGLLFVDGHEDTMPLDVVEDGGAANCEIGLLTGITGRLLTGPLADRLPALPLEALAMLGQRDDAWRRRFNIGSFADLGVWSRPLDLMRFYPAVTAINAAGHLRETATRWWLHVDLDVLDPDVYTAQGLPGIPEEPDGLTWAELTRALTGAVSVGCCAGLSVTIYDPDQDPDRTEAAAIVQLIGETVRAIE